MAGSKKTFYISKVLLARYFGITRRTLDKWLIRDGIDLRDGLRALKWISGVETASKISIDELGLLYAVLDERLEEMQEEMKSREFDNDDIEEFTKRLNLKKKLDKMAEVEPPTK